jgi:hypothetical protein
MNGRSAVVSNRLHRYLELSTDTVAMLDIHYRTEMIHVRAVGNLMYCSSPVLYRTTRGVIWGRQQMYGLSLLHIRDIRPCSQTATLGDITRRRIITSRK